MTTSFISSDNFEIFQRIQPQEYIKRFLDQKVRPDGRSLTDFRKTMITSGAISTANASSMIRLGGTTVVCGIKAEVCEPKVNVPNKGYLVPNVELSPLCSPKFKPGAPSDKAQSISEFINQLFIKSDVFPLDKLCIEEGKAVWVLYADIVCLNYDGNILDASLLALMVALKDLKLPKANVSPSLVVEIDAKSEDYVDISLNRFPVASTFSVFNNPDVILSDPNDTEESLSKEVITIVIDLNNTDDILKIYKNGGTTLNLIELKNTIHYAKQRTLEIESLIN